MSLWTYKQHSFSGGQIDDELMGRQDISQYYKGGSEVTNFTVKRQGYLEKRRGSNLLSSNFLGTWSVNTERIFPIVTSSDEGYYLIYNQGDLLLANAQRGVLLWGIDPDTGTVDRNTLSRREWVKGTLTSAQRSRIYKVTKSFGNPKTVDYCQCGDVIFFAQREIRPWKVTINYVADTFERPVIEVENIDFGSEKWNSPVSPSLTIVPPSGGWPSTTGSKTIKYRCSYIDTDGVETFCSKYSKITYGLPWPEGGKIRISSFFNGKSGQVAAFDHINIYKDEGAGFGLIGQVDELTQISGDGAHFSMEDDYISPDLTTTPRDELSTHNFAENTQAAPYRVAMYKQRLVYARDKRNPFTFWLSCTGEFNNFSTHESLQENDAITATLAATELPRIFHVLYGRELFILTESGEWVISPVSGNALTPSNTQAKLQSTIGTQENVKPMVIGNELIFTDQSGERLLATQYDLSQDGYKVTDLSEMCHNIFRDTKILRMVYKKCPDSTIYCMLGDGTVGVLTYVKDQNLCAWSRMKFSDERCVVDIATNKSVHNGSTEILFVTIKGNVTAGAPEIWVEKEGLPIEECTPLSHVVAMDGCRDLNYVAGSTTKVPINMTGVGKVTGTVFKSGSTTAKRATITEDCIIGFPIESEFVTVSADNSDGKGVRQGETFNPTQTIVREFGSSTFNVGIKGCNAVSTARLVPQVSAPVGTDEAKVTFTDKDVTTILTGTNTNDNRIRITHDEPWTFNILSLMVTYQYEEANINGGGNG